MAIINVVYASDDNFVGIMATSIVFSFDSQWV